MGNTAVATAVQQEMRPPPLVSSGTATSSSCERGDSSQHSLVIAPWDYSHARRHLHGLIRLDYLPLWAGAGLALEPVHDRLTRRT